MRARCTVRPPKPLSKTPITIFDFSAVAERVDLMGARRAWRKGNETREREFDAEARSRGGRRGENMRGQGALIPWRFAAADSTCGFERGDESEPRSDGQPEAYPT